VRLYTINGYDWSYRYPLIVEEGMRINVTAIMDAEVICTDGKGFPALRSFTADVTTIRLSPAPSIC
jgi:ATP-dependent DNA ligase